MPRYRFDPAPNGGSTVRINAVRNKLHVLNLPPDYGEQSSDDDGVVDTIGNIPREWYDDVDHQGYDLDGKPIPKSEVAEEQQDTLSAFLDPIDNPDHWKTVTDKYGRKVVLSDQDMSLIEKLSRGQVADDNYDPFPDLIPWASTQKTLMPLDQADLKKKNFTPSTLFNKRVSLQILFLPYSSIQGPIPRVT